MSGTAKAKILPTRQNDKIREVEDGQTDASYVPKIDKLEVDVEMPSNVVEISSKDGKLVFGSSKFKTRTLELE